MTQCETVTGRHRLQQGSSTILVGIVFQIQVPGLSALRLLAGSLERIALTTSRGGCARAGRDEPGRASGTGGRSRRDARA
jgi:hypothetical protein